MKQLNTELAKAREPKPQPWRESHWSNDLNYAYEFYQPGYYQRRRKLERDDSPLLKPLYLRDERFVREFDKAFTIARFDGFAAAIHTGPVGGIHQEWQRPYGFGGGGLCAFWTPDAGPVILARRRGVQGAVYDRFDEWRLWPVHAVSGLTGSGDLVTSTRIQQPEVESQCSATEAQVRVSGVLPKYIAAQQQTVPTGLRYERRFVLSAAGVRIETSVQAAGDDQLAELYETIPVFLRRDRRAAGHHHPFPDRLGVARCDAGDASRRPRRADGTRQGTGAHSFHSSRDCPPVARTSGTTGSRRRRMPHRAR